MLQTRSASANSTGSCGWRDLDACQACAAEAQRAQRRDDRGIVGQPQAIALQRQDGDSLAGWRLERLAVGIQGSDTRPFVAAGPTLGGRSK